VDGIGVDGGVVAATSNVEADTDNLELELLGLGQQGWDDVEGRPELDAEGTETLRVVGQDTDDELGLGVGALDLVQLVGIVEGHEVDALVRSIADEGNGLAWVGEDDARRVDPSDVKNLANFVERSTIEASAESGKKANDIRIRVTLDSYREGRTMLHWQKALIQQGGDIP
jgi:hypothetical protein